jgi:hypothetical protein
VGPARHALPQSILVLFGSSSEFMGGFGFRQMAKGVIERDFRAR